MKREIKKERKNLKENLNEKLKPLTTFYCNKSLNYNNYNNITT